MYTRCNMRERQPGGAIAARRRGASLRGLGDLGACAPSMGKQLAKAGVGAGLATAAAVDPEPISKIALGIAAGFSALFFPTTSKCAKQSPDPETFLKCWSHPVPNDFIPEWDPNKCGWFRWVKCPGAVAGHYPAAGCGPCDNPPGGPGFSGGKWTCWQGTEIAPGVPAWGQQPAQTQAQTTADILGPEVSNLLQNVSPMWYVAGGAVLLVLLRRRR